MVGSKVDVRRCGWQAVQQHCPTGWGGSYRRDTENEQQNCCLNFLESGIFARKSGIFVLTLEAVWVRLLRMLLQSRLSDRLDGLVDKIRRYVRLFMFFGVFPPVLDGRTLWACLWSVCFDMFT